jgi:hypothetical protein
VDDPRVFVVVLSSDAWVVVIIGVTGSTIGRYILSIYIPKVSSALVNRREDENLRYVGNKLTKAPFTAAIFVFLYTLMPLSTTALFTAVGIARVKPWYILPPFFFGRLVTDGVMVYTGKYAAGNFSDWLHGQMSWKSVLIIIAGLLVIGAFYLSIGVLFLKSASCVFTSRSFAEPPFPISCSRHTTSEGLRDDKEPTAIVREF